MLELIVIQTIKYGFIEYLLFSQSSHILLNLLNERYSFVKFLGIAELCQLVFTVYINMDLLVK